MAIDPNSLAYGEQKAPPPAATQLPTGQTVVPSGTALPSLPPGDTAAGGDKAAQEKAQADLRAQQAAASMGAQVILDYNSDAAKGARGGAGGSIEENTQARDADLVAMGFDPNDVTGPPPAGGAEAVRKAREAAEAPQFVPPPPSGNATRMTSLAAGISGENLPPAPEPPDGGGGEDTAPVNSEVPMVSQSGTTLNCTMGIWEGEPTSYAYAWQLDGTAAGSDAADYEVQPADVGKAATCTVTATNAAGSAAAPVSNSVTVA